MNKENIGYLSNNSEFEYLADVEEFPVPAGPGIYFDPKWFMAGFANGVENGLENMCPCRPAPIEVEAEVIKTEINKPTKGLLNESDS